MASIGSIFVDFVARTASFQENCKQAATTLQQTGASMNQSMNAVSKTGDQMTNAMERTALKVGASFLGARTVAMALSREIKDVYTNIDKIPGVPQATIDSIHMMKYELEGSNSVLKQGIAGMIGAFSDFGQKIGFGFGAMVYGADAAADAFGKMTEEAEAFANKDFDKKFEKLQTEMDRLKMTSGELASSLLKDADALDAYAGGADGTLDERHNATLEAGKARIAAQRTINQLSKEFQSLMDRDSTVEERYQIKLMGTAKAIEFLKAKKKELIEQRDQAIGSDFNSFIIDPEAVEKVNAKEKEVIETTKLLQQETIKAQKPFNEIVKIVGDDLTVAFVDTFNGAQDGFKKLGQAILQEIEKIVVKVMLLKPLFSAIGSMLTGTGVSFLGSLGTAFTGWAAAAADGGYRDGTQPYLVGERGPEIFNPGTPGTIIPNHALGGGGGSTYNIDARGADRTGMARLEAMIAQLNGSIERRSVAAVLSKTQRGGGMGRALQGA